MSKQGVINFAENLEQYLERACQLELEGDRLEAERFFELALFSEGKLRADVADAREYTSEAGLYISRL